MLARLRWPTVSDQPFHTMSDKARDQFISQMCSHLAERLEAEKTAEPRPALRLSRALNAADSLSFDFPRPPVEDMQALAAELERCASRAHSPSVAAQPDEFDRVFRLSPAFVDGVVYCAARAGDDPTAAEVYALIFVSLVRAMLTSTAVCRRLLTTFDVPPESNPTTDGALDEQGVDDFIERVVLAGEDHGPVAGAVNDEPEWADELDPEDFEYEGCHPSDAANALDHAGRGSSTDGVTMGAATGDFVPWPELRRRFFALVTRLSPSSMSALPQARWAALGLYQDVSSVVAILCAAPPDCVLLRDSVGPNFGWQAELDDAFSKFAFLLRDHAAEFPSACPNALPVLLRLVDDHDGAASDPLSTARSVGLIALHGVVRAPKVRASAVVPVLREALGARLATFALALDHATTRLSAGLPPPPPTPSPPPPSSPPRPSAADLVCHQAQVLTSLVAFYCGCDVEPGSKASSTVNPLGPSAANALLSSGVYASILRLVLALADQPPSSTSVGALAQADRLLLSVVARAPQVAVFCLRAPPVARLVECSGLRQALPGDAASWLLLLTINTTAADMPPPPSASRFAPLARASCHTLLDGLGARGGSAALGAGAAGKSTTCLRPLAELLDRLVALPATTAQTRRWMATDEGAWFRMWLEKDVVAFLVDVAPPAAAVDNQNPEAQEEASEKAASRAAQQRALRATTQRALKLLLETAVGGSKTD